MSQSITIQGKLQIAPMRGRPQRVKKPQVVEPTPGRVPRISRLMALAIRFDQLVRDGEVRDYAELARLAHVTRARMTQIMSLARLAPDIQEAILFLPRVERGNDPITLRHMLPIAVFVDWGRQRRMWQTQRRST